jgi:hypothetical protein
MWDISKNEIKQKTKVPDAVNIQVQSKFGYVFVFGTIIRVFKINGLFLTELPKHNSAVIDVLVSSDTYIITYDAYELRSYDIQTLKINKIWNP